MISSVPLLGTVAGSSATATAQTFGASAVTLASDAVGDFGQVMSQVASDTIDKLKTGESTSISGLQGKATVQQVVQAVGDAQGALQTALAVRDKAVAAYQDITRMSI